MKSLACIVAEAVLSADAGVADYTEILGALKPLYNTWVNKGDHENEYNRKQSLYKVAKPTAIQVAKKMIKDLQSAGAYDCKDFAQFMAKMKLDKRSNPNCYNIVASGSGAVLFSGKNESALDEISVYYMYKGYQHLYWVKFTDEGVLVSCNQQYSKKPVVADARAKFAFEIPGDIAEKIITAGEIND